MRDTRSRWARYRPTSVRLSAMSRQTVRTDFVAIVSRMSFVIPAFVPRAAHGQDARRLSGCVLDFLAQATDVDVHRARLHETVLTPDLVEQLRSREDAAAVTEEELQQPKLRGRQLDG